jgi:hypothetical protein
MWKLWRKEAQNVPPQLPHQRMIVGWSRTERRSGESFRKKKNKCSFKFNCSRNF